MSLKTVLIIILLPLERGIKELNKQLPLQESKVVFCNLNCSYCHTDYKIATTTIDSKGRTQETGNIKEWK